MVFGYLFRKKIVIGLLMVCACFVCFYTAQAAPLTSTRAAMSLHQAGAQASAEIEMQSPSGVGVGETITLSFTGANGFTTGFDLSNLLSSDVFSPGYTQGVDFTAAIVGQVLTITWNTAIAPGSIITVQIGPDFGGGNTIGLPSLSSYDYAQADPTIGESSAYSVLIGGTFGDGGLAIIPILSTDQVTFTATVLEETTTVESVSSTVGRRRNQATVLVEGYSAPDTVVEVYNQGQLIDTITTDQNGFFSGVLPNIRSGNRYELQLVPSTSPEFVSTAYRLEPFTYQSGDFAVGDIFIAPFAQAMVGDAPTMSGQTFPDSIVHMYVYDQEGVLLRSLSTISQANGDFVIPTLTLNLPDGVYAARFQAIHPEFGPSYLSEWVQWLVQNDTLPAVDDGIVSTLVSFFADLFDGSDPDSLPDETLTSLQELDSQPEFTRDSLGLGAFGDRVDAPLVLGRIAHTAALRPTYLEQERIARQVSTVPLMLTVMLLLAFNLIFLILYRNTVYLAVSRFTHDRL